MACFTALANAVQLDVSPGAEALYFKALPLLDEIDDLNNELFKLQHQLPDKEKIPEGTTAALKDKIRSLLAEATPLLRRSSDEENPAAQYRLAWLAIGFAPREQAVGQVCSLLKSSLKKGFAPAGLQMISYCFDDVKTVEFRTLIDALPEPTSPYSKYYPQPVLMPRCDRAHASKEEKVIGSLNEQAIRADLYMSLSTQMSRQNLKQEQMRYLQKSAEYGCTRAIEQLKLKAGIQVLPRAALAKAEFQV
ncbi:hypothetical protein KVG91_21495 [Pseudomonas sp. SWRI103]|uniref:Uncharacterized protein n=2 Tax=Pseudomonas TaxID=286 RepID=A0ABS6P531_9PSED|nr:hypothetical protein [Pseudomonas sp. SWRI 103]MBV4455156.1 hypothetical protein [Pseudomonas azadiae]NMF39217.1 hypothetical protein [Pseudomonas sp. SWRI 103]